MARDFTPYGSVFHPVVLLRFHLKKGSALKLALPDAVGLVSSMTRLEPDYFPFKSDL